MSEIYEFADFRLDVREHILERIASRERVNLPGKAFETLCILVRNRGKLVDKEELLREVWAGSFVEENNLNKSIHAIRRALGESSGEQKFIETVKKRGFRFVAGVRRVSDIPDDPFAPSTAAPINGGPKSASDQSTVLEFPQLSARTDSRSGQLALAASLERWVDSTSVREEKTSPESESSARFSNRRTSRIVAALATVVLLLAGVGLLYRYAGPVTTSSAGEGTLPRLAVLPPKAVDADERDRGIELAIADSIILKLSESKAFNVRRLSAVRRYVDLDEDPVNIGHELGDDFVLVSNYQIAAGRIRVTAQLINVSTGDSEHTINAETDTGDTFALRDALANEIGNAVFAKFGKPATRYTAARGTENEKAFNLFYDALYIIDKNTKEDSVKAAQLLGEAVALDPNYAQAWALQAQAYCFFAHLGGGVPDEVFKIAEPMLERALLLDNDNAVAFTVRATLNRDYHWNFDQAYKDLDRAIKIDPNYVMSRRILAGLYFRDRRLAEAVEEQKKAIEISPTSIIDKWFLGYYLVVAGRKDEGIAQLDRVAEMDPSFTPVYGYLWELYHLGGEHAKAYANFMKFKQKIGTNADVLAKYEDAYKRSGWMGVLRTELSVARSQDPVGEYSARKYYIATVAALVGEKDVAFDYLNESLRYRSLGISFLKVDAKLDGLRDDPRFDDLMRRAGLSVGSVPYLTQ